MKVENDHPFRVGDEVIVNACFCTKETQGLVRGKKAVIEDVHYYPSLHYSVRFAEPYACIRGCECTGATFFQQELEPVANKSNLQPQCSKK